MNKIREERIIEKAEKYVSVEFSIPKSSDYFDGHFPGFPILPAVAQIDIVMHFASRYLETSTGLSEIKRIKFTSPIMPGVPVVLEIHKRGNTVSFKINSPCGVILYSTGTVVLLVPQ